MSRYFLPLTTFNPRIACTPINYCQYYTCTNQVNTVCTQCEAGRYLTSSICLGIFLVFHLLNLLACCPPNTYQSANICPGTAVNTATCTSMVPKKPSNILKIVEPQHYLTVHCWGARTDGGFVLPAWQDTILLDMTVFHVILPRIVSRVPDRRMICVLLVLLACFLLVLVLAVLVCWIT